MGNTETESIILLGNDVVNLEDPDSTDALENAEFRERVFTPAEQRHIDTSPYPLAALWGIWAAKESAYKALKRVFPDTLFAWREYETDLEKNQVSYQGHCLFYWLNRNNRSVSVLCLGELKAGENTAAPREDLVHKVNLWIKALDSRADIPDAKNQSASIREWCVKKVARTLELERDGVTISEFSSATQEEDQNPGILYNGERTPHLISLSHHGRYMACAFLASNEITTS